MTSGEKEIEKEILRSMPFDIDAEKAVLSCLLKDRNLIPEAQTKLSPEAFYNPHHRTIFSALIDLENPDPITLTSRLRETEQLEKVGGPGFIADLLNDVPTVAMFAPYSEILCKRESLRNLIKIATQTIDACYDPAQNSEPSSLAGFLSDAAQKVVEQSIETKPSQTWREAVADALGEIEAAHNDEPIPGFLWPSEKLNRLTGKIPIGEMFVIAGGTGSGKSSWLSQVIENISQNHHVGIFSSEMVVKQLAKRALSRYSKINGKDLNAGRITSRDVGKLRYATELLNKFNIHPDSTPRPSLEYIEAVARTWKKDFGIEALAVDYLQILKAPPNCWSRENEVSELSKGLLAIAKKLELTVFVCAQTNLPPDARPKLGCLRESRAIEQDAYGIVCIWPDPEAGNDSEVDTEFVVTKWRDGGSTGSVDAIFQKTITKFIDA